MNMPEINEGAGAAGAAPNPHDAKAASPAFRHSVSDQQPPDGGSPCDAGAKDGAELFDRLHAFLRRFICYPSEAAAVSHVAWIAHTHFMDVWFATARLAVLSAEKESGKSRVLEITALLVPRPLLMVNSSVAYILRKVADQDNRPTILCDEIDTIYGPRARGNEELRGMINAGYRRGATTGRCQPDKGKMLTVELPTYAAMVLGGIGELPDTIMSRSVPIHMRRRGVDEVVEAFQPSEHEAIGFALNDELAAWAAGISSRAASWRPQLPPGVVDRLADIWSPLLTMADLAGGEWPGLVRAAAVELIQAEKAKASPSLGTQLLADARRCFGDADRMATAALLAALLADDEAPWGDLRGKRIDPRELAKLLRPYGIRSSTIRMPDGSTPKGYMREAFHDAWKRYLPVVEQNATSAAAATDQAAPK